MGRYIVTRKRIRYERVEIEADSAVAAAGRAEDLARGGLVKTWGGSPERWSTQRVAGS